MVWLDPSDYKKQKYIELRLFAPKSEKIFLDFNPLKFSDISDWNPAWEEWHCYATPLRIYKQDYELLLDYFNIIYPTKDAFDGTRELFFDVCSYNWIGENDWNKILLEIEQDLGNVSNDNKSFFNDFMEWVLEALKHTSIIVVEGNL